VVSVVPEASLRALQAIESRILWLATRIVDYANRERSSSDELKVGGHQASSASVVSLMTALYFWDLRGEDRVSIKPHASPVLHAIEYLLGRLPASTLQTFRDLHGLQAYPSRTKDPCPADFSTGSVGLGAAAPLFSALADRYVRAHFPDQSTGRYVSLIGDAELDEGNIWEAVLEPATRALENVLWIVDLNRQSLDRVVPIIRAQELERQFRALGWHVIELKYGHRLRDAFSQPGGHLLRRRIDEMPNQVYQALFGASEERVIDVILNNSSASERCELSDLLEQSCGRVSSLIRDLGGHDLLDIVGALNASRSERARPTIIFAYTIKGYGLPFAGRRLNHSALLNKSQIDELRAYAGLTPETEWDNFPTDSPEGQIVAEFASSNSQTSETRPSASCLVVA